jgi:hypothetical protein
MSPLRQIPITILAGSDHSPGDLPESGAGLHSLAVYKGAEVEVGGRHLIELLVEQIMACGGFGPITVAGPAAVYAALDLGDVRWVDTNGSVATNLHAAIDDHQGRHDPGVPMAMIAYDVIVSAVELDQLRQLYETDQPCALWLPAVRMPENKTALGPFAWKPYYTLLRDEQDDEKDTAMAGETVQLLPGHLAIFHPQSLRLPLLYKLLDLAYRTRNHSVALRRRVMVRSILGTLLLQDLRLLFSLHLPRITFAVISNGLRLARGLRRGSLSIAGLEHAVGGMFLRHARGTWSGPGNGIRIPPVDILSLAEDIDTEEEAEQYVPEPEPEPGEPSG